MKRLLLLLTFAATTACAQTPNTVIAGPYGVPQLVKSEGGDWSTPIEVFRDTKEIVYVPNITAPGWAAWHTRTFKEKHAYFTYVYTYLRKQRATVQDTLYVNVQTGHMIVVRFLRPPLVLDLAHATPDIAATTNAITRLVRDAIAHYHGPVID